LTGREMFKNQKCVMETQDKSPASPDNGAGADHQTTSQTTELPIHPVAEIIPLMLPDEFDKLVEDIRKKWPS
jgi:hypothetical protein